MGWVTESLYIVEVKDCCLFFTKVRKVTDLFLSLCRCAFDGLRYAAAFIGLVQPLLIIKLLLTTILETLLGWKPTFQYGSLKKYFCKNVSGLMNLLLYPKPSF